jgi:hypothetical protein
MKRAAGMSKRQIGELFGCLSDSAVRKVYQRFMIKKSEDKSFRKGSTGLQTVCLMSWPAPQSHASQVWARLHWALPGIFSNQLRVSAFNVVQIRFIQIPVTEAVDLRIIQPVHHQFNHLSLGFLGKEENKNDPCSLNQCRVFHPRVIQEPKTPFPSGFRFNLQNPFSFAPVNE